jgi:hypothetical protein
VLVPASVVDEVWGNGVPGRSLSSSLSKSRARSWLPDGICDDDDACSCSLCASVANITLDDGSPPTAEDVSAMPDDALTKAAEFSVTLSARRERRRPRARREMTLRKDDDDLGGWCGVALADTRGSAGAEASCWRVSLEEV